VQGLDLAGLEALGGLKALRECELNFEGTAIRDLRPLGAGLGDNEQLRSLTLNFKDCKALEDAAGLEALGGLEALQECKLDFCNSAIRDVSALQVVLGGLCEHCKGTVDLRYTQVPPQLRLDGTSSSGEERFVVLGKWGKVS